MPQIVTSNILINYNHFAEKAGNSGCLLFLHGWRSEGGVWEGTIKQLNNLTNKRFSIYALDLPGFGKSQTPIKLMTVGDYAEVVAGFIKKLELKNVIIVGHSFGGRIAIKLSSEHPELINKLVLVDSAGFAADQNKKSLMAAGAKIVKPFFKPKFMQGLRKKIYKQIGAEDYVATPELQKSFVNIVGENLSEDMKKINCPTLIINGENDQDTPVSYGQRMQALISNSKFVIIKDAGHFSFIDQPKQFTEFLNSFIGNS